MHKVAGADAAEDDYDNNAHDPPPIGAKLRPPLSKPPVMPPPAARKPPRIPAPRPPTPPIAAGMAGKGGLIRLPQQQQQHLEAIAAAIAAGRKS